MIGIKTCTIWLSWIASSLHPQPKKKPISMVDELIRGIKGGRGASKFTDEIIRLAEEELKQK